MNLFKKKETKYCCHCKYYMSDKEYPAGHKLRVKFAKCMHPNSIRVEESLICDTLSEHYSFCELRRSIGCGKEAIDYKETRWT